MGQCFDCPHMNPTEGTAPARRTCCLDTGTPARLMMARERDTDFRLPAIKPEPNNRHFRRRAAKLAR